VQDRSRIEVTPLAFSAIAVHRWTDAGNRLLIANFGPKLDVSVAQLPGAERHWNVTDWSLLLESTAARYEGDRREAVMLVRDGERRITIPARSASIWSLE
jgi:hypothetical protein